MIKDEEICTMENRKVGIVIVNLNGYHKNFYKEFGMPIQDVCGQFFF